MTNINQQITGNNNTQVSGDYIITHKYIKKTKVIHNADMHITDAQAKEIKDKIQKIAESRSNESKYSYPQAYKSLYDKYSITSYKLLPKDKYIDAVKWLDKQIAIYRSKLKNVDKEQYKKDMYTSINARANQLGINVHEFANQTLELKKPISSLKELSDARCTIGQTLSQIIWQIMDKILMPLHAKIPYKTNDTTQE